MNSDTPDKPRLMVVDDEQDNLDLLYRTFRRDFNVYKATSGQEALEILAQQGEMAIIISDQRMPKMNGTEFLSRTVDAFPDTIRIVLTGYTDLEDLVGAINAGKVFKYITKPWNPQEMRKVVLQASETYRVVKQRTKDLTRSLRRESLINEVMSAVRESLDYPSMLQTIVNTLGKTFEADYAVLYPCASLSPDRPVEQPRFDYAAHPDSQIPPEVMALIHASQDPGVDSSANTRSSPHVPRLIPVGEDGQTVALTLELVYQQRFLAYLGMYQATAAHWSDETLDLISSIADQVALAIDQASLYQQIQHQSQQMRAELEVARQIQMNLLQQSWPEIEGVRIQARCLPAREVGGDFFEICVHSQGDIWLAVGDVSGKGVPAALFMASTISVLRRELSQEQPPSPEILMQTLNAGLMTDLVSSNCFITAVLVRYSPRSGRLTYANAGHVYPLMWSQAQSGSAAQPDPTYLKARGVPLGILPHWTAAAGELQMQAGDQLLLVSDGLTEAVLPSLTPNDDADPPPMLKQEGLWQLLQHLPSPLELDDLLAKLKVLSPHQDDDQTVLSLEVQL